MTSERPISNVMIVDDEQFDQLVYRRIISRSNLVDNVLPFTSPLDALRFLETRDREKVNVVFLDINMPKMNGFEFLEHLMENAEISHLNPVIVMLTTSMNPADRARAENYDVVKDYITKPLKIEHLQSVATTIAQHDAF